MQLTHSSDIEAGDLVLVLDDRPPRAGPTVSLIAWHRHYVLGRQHGCYDVASRRFTARVLLEGALCYVVQKVAIPDVWEKEFNVGPYPGKSICAEIAHTVGQWVDENLEPHLTGVREMLEQTAEALRP